jgi:hypothetical protein
VVILVLPQIIEKAAMVLAIARANPQDVAAVAAAVFGQRNCATPLDGKEEDTDNDSGRGDKREPAELAEIANVSKLRRLCRGLVRPKLL